MSDFTRILGRLESGDSAVADELLALVYDELRELASRRMSREPGPQTLQPTALVHEAWLRLGGDVQPSWQNRGHFFAAAAESMRRILIDRARSRQAVRNGGGMERCGLDAVEIESPEPADELLQVHEALGAFAAEEPAKAELVKLRYFVGLGLGESAAILGVSEATAVRWWNYSKAWLHHAIRTARTGENTSQVAGGPPRGNSEQS